MLLGAFRWMICSTAQLDGPALVGLYADRRYLIRLPHHLAISDEHAPGQVLSL